MAVQEITHSPFAERGTAQTQRRTGLTELDERTDNMRTAIAPMGAKEGTWKTKSISAVTSGEAVDQLLANLERELEESNFDPETLIGMVVIITVVLMAATSREDHRWRELEKQVGHTLQEMSLSHYNSWTAMATKTVPALIKVSGGVIATMGSDNFPAFLDSYRGERDPSSTLLRATEMYAAPGDAISGAIEGRDMARREEGQVGSTTAKDGARERGQQEQAGRQKVGQLLDQKDKLEDGLARVIEKLLN